jgi:hypothetical protein
LHYRRSCKYQTVNEELHCSFYASVALCEWIVQSNESCIHVVVRFDQKLSRQRLCVWGLCCVRVHLSRSVVSIGYAPVRAERGIRLSSGFPSFWLQYILADFYYLLHFFVTSFLYEGMHIFFVLCHDLHSFKSVTHQVMFTSLCVRYVKRND